MIWPAGSSKLIALGRGLNFELKCLKKHLSVCDIGISSSWRRQKIYSARLAAFEAAVKANLVYKGLYAKDAMRWLQGAWRTIKGNQDLAFYEARLT